MVNGHAKPALTFSAVGEQLGVLIDRLTERYTVVLRLLREHHEAIRRADGAAVGEVTERQTLVIAEIEALDRRRRDLVAAAAAAFPQAAQGRTLTITHLAALLPEPDRSRLTNGAERLRELAGEVKERSASIRAATATLVAHVEGLVRQVGKQLSHAGTYGRRGVVESGQPVLSALDLRS